jgi:FtsP/CotA-like multicopper oxidase with cupredoxin domain
VHFRTVVIPLLAALVCAAPAPRASRALRVASNDNRHAAGRLANGVLTVSLEARQGEWQPEGKSGYTHMIAAFAEPGKAPRIPGPLIRVPVGTEIRATVSNQLAKTMLLYGMGAKRGSADSVQLAPNERRELRFRVTEPGAYYYLARTDSFPVFARFTEDGQLGGVIIVDPVGYTPPANERILAITSWFTFDPNRVSGLGPTPSVTFNGMAWPATERMTFTQGDTVAFAS